MNDVGGNNGFSSSGLLQLVKQMPVPYVPSLGLVHPSAVETALHDVIQATGAERFLAYDKSSRWFEEKNEEILLDGVFQDREQTIIPTVYRDLQGNRIIRYYHYSGSSVTGHSILGLMGEKHEEICKRVLPSKIQLIRFSREIQAVGVLVFLGITQSYVPDSNFNIEPLSSISKSIASTLPTVSSNPEASGLSFLYYRWVDGRVNGEILVVVDQGTIVGVIGPLQVVPDAIGVKMLWPPYFHVAEEKRRRGIGRALWRSAMSWTFQNGASYLMFDVSADSPFVGFYRNEGCEILGTTERVVV